MILKTSLNEINSSSLSKIEFINNDKTKDSFSLSDTGALRVKFQNNTTYIYYDVPFSIFLDILFAESAGQTFSSKVKTKYRYEKIG